MKELILEKTVKTPYVHCDAKSGIIKINGRSIPENPEEFYTQIFSWLKDYYVNPQPETSVQVQLEYINSGSSKFILELFYIVQDFYKTGANSKINWYYEEDDEAVLELGKHYQSILTIPFKLIETY
ncbi:MAG: DUF1987 domain-containing protein [Bacteroidales bacterium]